MHICWVHPWKLNQLYVLWVIDFTYVQFYLGVLSIFVEFSNLLNIEFPSSTAPKTCTHGFQWSFTFSLIINVVNRLAKKGKQIEALSFAHSFGIMNHVQNVPLLKTYLKEAHKTTQSFLKTRKQNSLTTMQVIKIHL